MTNRTLIIGNPGSGKSTMGLARAEPYRTAIFINTQNNVLPGTWEPAPDDWRNPVFLINKKWSVRVTRSFDIEEFWFDNLKPLIEELRRSGYTVPIMVVVDEISLFGITGKQSRPDWYVDLLSRSRKLCDIVMMNHSTYQIPNYTFNMLTHVIFMRVGDSRAEWNYLDQWFTGLREYKDILAKDYHFVIYDISTGQYQPYAPLGADPENEEPEPEPVPDPEDEEPPPEDPEPDEIEPEPVIADL